MAYRLVGRGKNRRVQWGFWHQSWPTGRGGKVEVVRCWQDQGPANLTRHDRALLAMSGMENKGQTGRALYALARSIAIATM